MVKKGLFPDSEASVSPFCGLLILTFLSVGHGVLPWIVWNLIVL